MLFLLLQLLSFANNSNNRLCLDVLEQAIATARKEPPLMKIADDELVDTYSYEATKDKEYRIFVDYYSRNPRDPYRVVTLKSRKVITYFKQANGKWSVTTREFDKSQNMTSNPVTVRDQEIGPVHRELIKARNEEIYQVKKIIEKQLALFDLPKDSLVNLEKTVPKNDYVKRLETSQNHRYQTYLLARKVLSLPPEKLAEVILAEDPYYQGKDKWMYPLSEILSHLRKDGPKGSIPLFANRYLAVTSALAKLREAGYHAEAEVYVNEIFAEFKKRLNR